MTSDNSNEQFSEARPVTPVGPLLKEARERENLTLETVAQRLNISQKYVAALEADNYTDLPGATYTKGYIRAYARLVNLSGDELVQHFQAWTGDTVPTRAVKSINTIDEQVRVSHPLMKVSLLIFVLALGAVSFWWWQAQSQAPAVVEDAPQTEESSSSANTGVTESFIEMEPVVPEDFDVDVKAEAEAEAEVGTEADTATEASVNAVDQPTPSPDVQVEAAEPPEPVIETVTPEDIVVTPPTTIEAVPATPDQADVPTETTAAEVAMGTLYISFSGDCWVSIRDADGNMIYASTKQAGETLSLELPSSSNLLVGRASSVIEARFNGEPLTIKGGSSSDVARLTLEL